MSAVRFVRQALSMVGSATILILAGCTGATPPPAAPPAAVSEVTGQASTPPVTPAQFVESVEPEPTAPSAGTTVEGFYPLTTRTGIAAVDRFIAALQNGKTEELLDQYQAMELPCVKREGLGAPLCPEGQPAGTPVQAYPYAWCNVAFLTDQAQFRQYIGSAFRGGRYLFAVYRTDQALDLEKAGVSPAYAVVLAGSLGDHSAPTVYLDQDGNLILVRWGCGTPDLAVPEGADVVLAPKVVASDEQRSQAEAGLAGVVEGEARRMHASLRAALGEYDPCSGSSGPCIMDTNFSRVVEGLIARCDKVGPEAQMSGYAYNELRHGPVFRPYKAACDTLRIAEATLGPPGETPEWKESALTARQLLEPAVQYLDVRNKK